MDWLSQNWLWVALALGALFFMFRGGLGGHGAGRGGLIGMGHGGYARDGGQSDQSAARTAANPPEAAIDPVSGAPVRTAQAVTSLYQGKIYYFASKETRDRFEAAPADYAQKATGYSVAAPEYRRHRRGGC